MATGSVERKQDSLPKRTVITRENIESVQELVLSLRKSGTHWFKSQEKPTEIIIVIKFPFSDTTLKIVIFSPKNSTIP